MRKRMIVAVTFDPRYGYVAVHDGLPAITALSLSMLRQRIEARQFVTVITAKARHSIYVYRMQRN